MVRVTMGTMSASDAAPLPRLGEVFFDVRGDSRTMRVSWYADTGVAVFSIWQGDTCTGTFRLPIPELPRMVEALTKGPPGTAGSGSRTGGSGQRQADSGPSTAAMGPGRLPAPRPGQPGDYPPPYRDHEQAPLDRGRTDPLAAGYPGFAPGGGYPSPQHGYGAPDAGYGAAAPAGHHQDGPPAGGYTHTGPGGYQGQAPGGQFQMPADSYYREPAPEGHHDQPPAGYYPPSDGYQDLPAGGGYQDLPAGGGYGDVSPGAEYRPPDDGYREPPAATADGGPAQFAGRQQDPYPPTGPLPVGRWHSGAPSGEFAQARPEGGFAPDRFAEDGFTRDRFAAGELGPDGYPGEEFAQDRYAADRFPDDPLADSYQGEAEEGYLPSPPTDMFPAASLSGGHRGQGSHRAGYEPDPAGTDHESQYPAGHADRGGPPPDSVPYRPGRGGPREREYGHSRGGS